MLKNKKLLSILIIVLVVIITGIIFATIKGFEYDEYYSQNVKVEYVDIINQYALPTILSFVIILIYFGLKFRKQNAIKVISYTIAVVSIIELLAISIIAICRIPLSIYIIPILLCLYILALLYLTYYFENNKQI